MDVVVNELGEYDILVGRENVERSPDFSFHLSIQISSHGFQLPSFSRAHKENERERVKARSLEIVAKVCNK